MGWKYAACMLQKPGTVKCIVCSKCRCHGGSQVVANIAHNTFSFHQVYSTSPIPATQQSLLHLRVRLAMQTGNDTHIHTHQQYIHSISHTRTHMTISQHYRPCVTFNQSAGDAALQHSEGPVPLPHHSSPRGPAGGPLAGRAAACKGPRLVPSRL